MKKYLSAAFLLALSNAASAHTGHLPGEGFMHGFQHPFLGPDHFLVMLGLGLWASSQSSSLAKQAIAVFLCFMLAGAVLGLNGLSFAQVETAIVVSLMGVGLALSLGTARLPNAFILSSIALFATMHGLAHGAEMPVAASAYGYIAGILSGTALLHVSGLALGRMNGNGLIKLYGTLTGLTGAWLLFNA